MVKLLSLHRKSFISAIKNIAIHPIEHGLNILVLAVIIAILGVVSTINKNINLWESNSISFPQVMVYLDSHASRDDIAKMETEINKTSSKIISGYRVISQEDGINELQQDPDLKNIASNVVSNMHAVLPPVLVISLNTANRERLMQLKHNIDTMPMVGKVQMDSDYASKVSDLISFTHKIIGGLQMVVIVVLVLVVYNMIRLQMFLREDEIMTSRLIGASDSFIMRPLAYYSLLQVGLGSAVAYYLMYLFVKFMNRLFIDFDSLFGRSMFITNLHAIQLIEIGLILLGFTLCAVFVAVHSVFRNKYTQ